MTLQHTISQSFLFLVVECHAAILNISLKSVKGELPVCCWFPFACPSEYPLFLDSNRTSSVFLSNSIDSDFTTGMLYVGVYIDSTKYPNYKFSNSFVSINAWSIDSSLTCPDDCHGKGTCRNGKCVCYEAKCQGGFCHLPAAANCAFGCADSCDGTTLCYPRC